MQHKRILVLANSFKHHARCIAGRELAPGGRLGPWIRPVGHHGEGELSLDETQLSSGRHADVWQYISIPLDRHAGDRFQPENWLIHGLGNWLDLDASCPKYALESLIECPANLWHEPGGHSDCVSHRHLQAAPPEQSLYVIQPHGLRVHVESRDDKTKWRAIFKYNGLDYNFSITDPVFLWKHSAWIRGKALPFDSPLPCGDRCLLCVSLGGMWQGKHYKLAATIFENVP